MVAVVPDVPRICAAEATRSRSMLSAVFVVIDLSIDINCIDVYPCGLRITASLRDVDCFLAMPG